MNTHKKAKRNCFAFFFVFIGEEKEIDYEKI